MGGLLTMLPDLGILAGITLRMIQKLSLIYGFSYNTADEEAESDAPPRENQKNNPREDEGNADAVEELVPRVRVFVVVLSHVLREGRHWQSSCLYTLWTDLVQ